MVKSSAGSVIVIWAPLQAFDLSQMNDSTELMFNVNPAHASCSTHSTVHDSSSAHVAVIVVSWQQLADSHLISLMLVRVRVAPGVLAVDLVWLCIK